MGKLIVIEGLDGSGKSTQLEILTNRLEKENIPLKTISFPNYNEQSSALVRMYLSGEFGSNPSDVNAYAASLFYAVDRYASFKKHWKDHYDNAGLVVAGRYATSNIIHQMSKLKETEWDTFLTWLYDLEFNKVMIPKPDLVVFLDMPNEVAQKMLSKRYCGDDQKKDIHEKNVEYLKNCSKAAKYAANCLGWHIINCSLNGEPRSIESISDDVLNLVKTII